jgi:hypothetical protein
VGGEGCAASQYGRHGSTRPTRAMTQSARARTHLFLAVKTAAVDLCVTCSAALNATTAIS